MYNVPARYSVPVIYNVQYFNISVLSTYDMLLLFEYKHNVTYILFILIALNSRLESQGLNIIRDNCKYNCVCVCVCVCQTHTLLSYVFIY